MTERERDEGDGGNPANWSPGDVVETVIHRRLLLAREPGGWRVRHPERDVGSWFISDADAIGNQYRRVPRAPEASEGAAEGTEEDEPCVCVPGETGPFCDDDVGGLYCTRFPGHEQHHVACAGKGSHFLGVWGGEEEPPLPDELASLRRRVRAQRGEIARLHRMQEEKGLAALFSTAKRLRDERDAARAKLAAIESQRDTTAEQLGEKLAEMRNKHLDAEIAKERAEKELRHTTEAFTDAVKDLNKATNERDAARAKLAKAEEDRDAYKANAERFKEQGIAAHDTWESMCNRARQKLAARDRDLAEAFQQRDAERRAREDAEGKLEVSENLIADLKRKIPLGVYCSYCHLRITGDSEDAAPIEHMRTCEKHPMRALEAKLAAAEEEIAALKANQRDAAREERLTRERELAFRNAVALRDKLAAIRKILEDEGEQA